MFIMDLVLDTFLWYTIWNIVHSIACSFRTRLVDLDASGGYLHLLKHGWHSLHVIVIRTGGLLLVPTTKTSRWCIQSVGVSDSFLSSGPHVFSISFLVCLFFWILVA